jgi:hypothetical protein
MLLNSSGMLLAKLLGMLSRLGGVLPIAKGMLSVTGMLSLVGMLLAEIAGMLWRSFSVLLVLLWYVTSVGRYVTSLSVCYAEKLCKIYSDVFLICSHSMLPLKYNT